MGTLGVHLPLLTSHAKEYPPEAYLHSMTKPQAEFRTGDNLSHKRLSAGDVCIAFFDHAQRELNVVLGVRFLLQPQQSGNPTLSPNRTCLGDVEASSHIFADVGAPRSKAAQ